MKESLTTNDNSIIFRETFENETSVRNNGGIPINVTFKNGECSFIAASTRKIVYKLYNIQTIQFNLNSVTSFYCKLSSTRNIQVVSNTLSSNGFTSPIYYINGIVSTTVPSIGNVQIVVVDTVIYKTSDFQLGYNGITYGTFNCDLLNCYNRTLSASEVKNLYNNKTNVTLPKVINSTKKLILDVNAYSGIIKNYGIGATTLTNNGVLIENEGGRNVMRFPNAAYLDLGNYHPLTGDITMFGIVKIQTKGVTQRILYNTQLYVSYVSSLIGVANSNAATMLSSSMEVGKYVFICITRSLSGVTNIYIGVSNSFGLNGSANQVGTTPVAGTNINVGGTGTLFTLKDKLSSLKVYEGILSLDEITQEYTSNKSKL